MRTDPLVVRRATKNHQRLDLSHSSPRRSACIADIGCGTGGNIGSLDDDYRCIGIDRSEEAIELARGRFPGVRFICDDAVNGFSRIASQANMVLLTDVLEHFADDAGMLARLIKIARPGTYFLLAVPADPVLWSHHDEAHGHYRRYDRRHLERLWLGQPVRPMLVSYFNARLYPLVRLVRGSTASEASRAAKPEPTSGSPQRRSTGS